MFITALGQHSAILGKPQMKKHRVLLDILRDKVIFLPEYSNYQRSISPPLVPAKITPKPALEPLVPQKKPSITILRRPPPPAYKDPADFAPKEDPLPSKKKRKKKRPNLPLPDTSSSESSDSEAERIDIHQVNTTGYLHLAKQLDMQLFSLTISEIDYTLGLDPPVSTPLPQESKVTSPRNAPCPYGSHSKFKKCCGSWMKNDVQLNATTLSDAEIKARLPPKYHDFLDVFDKAKANILPPHRPYDHKLEFTQEGHQNLPKSRLYPISGYKLQKVKEYLEEHLKKGFIVPSQAPFASPVLFAAKPDRGLRFYIDYRKLNAITKRNRYPIPLIDKVLGRVQGYKYLTRLDIITAFNKLRIHPESEDFTTFITSLGVYKYRVLLFGLTNGPASYQQYMNNILFEFLNDFYQAYLDDILIYSKTLKEHKKYIRQVLQKLREAGLQVDIQKCEFYV